MTFSITDQKTFIQPDPLTHHDLHLETFTVEQNRKILPNHTYEVTLFYNENRAREDCFFIVKKNFKGHEVKTFCRPNPCLRLANLDIESEISVKAQICSNEDQGERLIRHFEKRGLVFEPKTQTTPEYLVGNPEVFNLE